MKRVLGFFGAFNPPTQAHLLLAEHAMHQTGREGVLFVPSKADYIVGAQHKDGALDDKARLELLRILTRTRPWMEVTDWEMRQEKQPRTYETLCALKDEGWECALLIGSDKLGEMDTGWRYVEEIAEEFGMVCLARGADRVEEIIDGSPRLRPLKDHISVIETPEEMKAVSSTKVREHLRRLCEIQRALGELVPRDILAPLTEAWTREE
ncbi:MAG: hypothetical protein IJ708_09605 [Clostridia bacterium]|nr:hypothetical protein [Clostridia bacterium]